MYFRSDNNTRCGKGYLKKKEKFSPDTNLTVYITCTIVYGMYIFMYNTVQVCVSFVSVHCAVCREESKKLHKPKESRSEKCGKYEEKEEIVLSCFCLKCLK